MLMELSFRMLGAEHVHYWMLMTMHYSLIIILTTITTTLLSLLLLGFQLVGILPMTAPQHKLLIISCKSLRSSIQS